MTLKNILHAVCASFVVLCFICFVNVTQHQSTSLLTVYACVDRKYVPEDCPETLLSLTFQCASCTPDVSRQGRIHLFRWYHTRHTCCFAPLCDGFPNECMNKNESWSMTYHRTASNMTTKQLYGCISFQLAHSCFLCCSFLWPLVLLCLVMVAGATQLY